MADYAQFQPKTKRGYWKDAITKEECGVFVLPDPADQSNAHDLVNMMYSKHNCKSNVMIPKRDCYSIVFEMCENIDGVTLETLVKTYPLIRDIKVKQIGYRDSVNNKPYFNIEVEMYSATNSGLTDLPMPVFTPSNVNVCPLTKEKVAEAFTGQSKNNKWKKEWDIPFHLLRNVSNALCNIGQHPPDIGIDIPWDIVDGKPVFGLAVYGFEEISYSLLEHIDMIKHFAYLWSVQFETNLKEGRNYVIFKFVENTGGNHSVVINKVEYATSYSRRSFGTNASEPKTTFKTKRKRDEEAEVYKSDYVEEPEQQPEKKSKWNFISKLFGE